MVLLDVVLGYGANADPASALVPAIRDAQQRAARANRSLAVVASVCGTDADPQGRSAQESILAAAGVILAPSNAQAAGIAAAIAAWAPDRAGGRSDPAGGTSDRGGGLSGRAGTSGRAGMGATL